MSTPGGFDFEQLRRMMEQLGINSEDLDLDELMKQVQRLQGSGGISFGFTPADRDPEAAWRTTIAAARRIASELGAETITINPLDGDWEKQLLLIAEALRGASRAH